MHRSILSLGVLALLLSGQYFFNGVAVAQETAATVDDSTLYLWRFDEGQGANINNAAPGAIAAGNAVAGNAVAGNAVASGGYSWTKGNFGDALSLNGIDGKATVQIPQPVIFAENESYTVDAWVKVFRSGATQQIFDSSPLCQLEVRPEGFVSFSIAAMAGDLHARCSGPTRIDNGKWHHVAGVRDVTAGKLLLYIDGRLDAEEADPTAGQVKTGIATTTFIGSTGNNKEMLEGEIDEVRISKGVRSFAAESATIVDKHAKTYTLENARTKMVFTASQGKLYLSEWIDKLSGVNFIETGLAGQRVNNLWQVNMRAGAGTPQIRSTIIDERDSAVTIKRRQTGNAEELGFNWRALPVKEMKGAVDVSMRVLLPRDSAFAQWYIDVDNRSKEFGAWIVKFPAINNLKKLSNDGHDYLAIPGGNGGGAGEGQLVTDPFTKMHAFVRTYPCYQQSMQFNAYYGPQGGLYFGAHDGASNLKGFYITPVKSDMPAMIYEVQNYPANSGVGGTSYHQTYASVIGPFKGDWYDACKIYRQWALRQKWARLGPLAQRTDIASSIRKGSFWMMGTFEWEPTTAPLMRRLARSLPIEEVQKRARHIDVEKSLALVKEAYDYFHYPIILWTNEWYEGGGDMTPPRYVPMNNLQQFLKELHTRYPEVKLSAYVAPKRFSIQTPEYTEEVVRTLEKKADGELRIGAPMPKESDDQHAVPCWTTDFWKKYWGQKAYDRASLGIDGFHVDELASATSFDSQCFNRAHGHPIGGGDLYATTRRTMLKNIRDNARRANPDFATHHEALNEIYIDIDDLQEVCTSPSNINIPLFETVYHDYNFQMGRRIIKWNDRRTFPKGREDGDSDIDEFMSSFAQTYIWGNQPAWMRIDIASYAPRVAAITKQFMDARYRAMKFLNVGEMMRPLTVTTPLPQLKTTWRFNDTPEHIMPAVINSVWKAADGSIGIVLANITQTPQTIDYRCDLAEAGLQGKQFSLRRIDDIVAQDLGQSQGSVLQRSDTLSAQSVMIIEVKAVGP